MHKDTPRSTRNNTAEGRPPTFFNLRSVAVTLLGFLGFPPSNPDLLIYWIFQRSPMHACHRLSFWTERGFDYPLRQKTGDFFDGADKTGGESGDSWEGWKGACFLVLCPFPIRALPSRIPVLSVIPNPSIHPSHSVSLVYFATLRVLPEEDLGSHAHGPRPAHRGRLCSRRGCEQGAWAALARYRGLEGGAPA
ncbi:hypothetical protein C8R47DRAFT_600391 [Mycena vitilis]|nr:hypothetical protein C8R47DRAFT_600391 [Mycena vitilis]